MDRVTYLQATADRYRALAAGESGDDAAARLADVVALRTRFRTAPRRPREQLSQPGGD
jgi:hypothetical protein